MKTMLKTFFILFGAVATCSALQAQDIAGKWCGQGNPQDCLVLTISPNSPEIVSCVF